MAPPGRTSTPSNLLLELLPTVVSVLAPAESVGKLESVLFRETGTFGVRRFEARRSKLRREPCTVETPWGPVRCKRGWRPGQPPVVTPEYEDCARVAREHGVPLRAVYTAVQKSSS